MVFENFSRKLKRWNNFIEFFRNIQAFLVNYVIAFTSNMKTLTYKFDKAKAHVLSQSSKCSKQK